MGMQHGQVSRVRLLHIMYGKFLGFFSFACLSGVRHTRLPYLSARAATMALMRECVYGRGLSRLYTVAKTAPTMKLVTATPNSP
jgi:hypothetical protein